MRKLALIAIRTAATVEICECKVVQFIFGDSLSDVGDNNQLSKSLAKASLPWYGIDFGNGLSRGRFSNSRTVADIIGDKMGRPMPPAFLDSSLTEDIILENGVNYASGGGGILKGMGTHFVQRFSLYKQVELFQGTQDLIGNKIGVEAANNFFRGSKYVVALGSNDFINNYLMPVYSDEGFVQYMTETLQQQLGAVVSTGGKAINGVWIGADGLHSTPEGVKPCGCQDRANKSALDFNQQTKTMLQAMLAKFTDASFLFGDAYDVINDVISNPYKYGFNNSEVPCCSFGKIRPALTCIPVSSLCKDRSKYVFWDEYHPIDSANEIIANELIHVKKQYAARSTDYRSGIALAT